MADIECCPTCNRPLEIKLTPLQRKVLPLADGERSYADIAKQLGATKNSVTGAIGFLRAIGHPVRGLRRGHLRNHRKNKVRMSRMEFDKMLAQRKLGLTWAQIGVSLGIEGTSVQGRAKRASDYFGIAFPPDPRQRGRKKGPPVLRPGDYVKMHELRVEADLPWRMVGQAMGLSGWRAQKYFEKLQKVYEPCAG